MTDHSEFGIGSLGHTPESDALVDLEAQRRQPQSRGRRVTCDNCGASIPAILAMSSAVGTVCPDCYDECEF
jgi:formylmethanofuran dehydrogenase subunit E